MRCFNYELAHVTIFRFVTRFWASASNVTWCVWTGPKCNTFDCVNACKNSSASGSVYFIPKNWTTNYHCISELNRRTITNHDITLIYPEQQNDAFSRDSLTWDSNPQLVDCKANISSTGIYTARNYLYVHLWHK
jgi:hypothetical protein